MSSSSQSHGRRSHEVATEIQHDPLGLLPDAERLCPELTWGDTRGEVHAARIEGEATIGSSPQVDVSLEDRAVSRLHARLDLRADGLWITDLGSQNGTFVEGLRVSSARLDHGCRLRLGSTSLTVSYPSTPSPVGLWKVDSFGPMVGRSVVMRELFARLGQAASSDATLLIRGETGTGKELCARAVHEASRRVNGPFIVFDCGAIHEGVIEAELFGHRRGAFTGAEAAHSGAVEAAASGVLFLDEVGELPLQLQPKLLRVMESRTVRRMGEAHERPVDVRFIAATHRDLRRMVNEGSFREDLYFRLAVLQVTVPPLRERREDISLLVEQFLPEGVLGPTPELIRELGGRPWRGNVRELRNFVERAVAFGTDQAFESSTLLSTEEPEISGSDLPEVPLDRPFKEIRDRWLDHLEREYLVGLLDRYNGNVSAVAQAAGLNRSYVHRLLRKHRL